MSGLGLLAAGNTTEMSGYQTQIEMDSDALIGLANLASQASIAVKNAQLYAHQVAMNQVLQATNQQLESFAFSAAPTSRARHFPSPANFSAPTIERTWL